MINCFHDRKLDRSCATGRLCAGFATTRTSRAGRLALCVLTISLSFRFTRLRVTALPIRFERRTAILPPGDSLFVQMILKNGHSHFSPCVKTFRISPCFRRRFLFGKQNCRSGLPFIGNGKTFSAFFTACGKDFPAVFGCLAGTESMLIDPLAFVRLIRTPHSVSLLLWSPTPIQAVVPIFSSAESAVAVHQPSCTKAMEGPSNAFVFGFISKFFRVGG